MIPKIIHYCWFGGKPKPHSVKKYIETWKKQCPGYEIKEWNEFNFNIDFLPYVREAYDNKKFAFVTDVVRLYALYFEGGIYMDTDVELISSLDPFLQHRAFSGFEAIDRVQTALMGCEKNCQWAKDFLDSYKNRHFINSDGSFDLTTNVEVITRLLVKKGLQLNNKYQEITDYFTVYPTDYFCSKSWETGIITKTQRTVAIHHFNASWQRWYERYDKKIKDKFGISYPINHKIQMVLYYLKLVKKL